MPSEPSTSYFDRQTGEVRTLAEPSDGALAFAYGTPVGRLLLKVMASPWPSELWGRLMRSPLSRGRVARFCAQNGITNASLTRAGFAPMESYRSFAAFFERTRPAPCAGEPGVLYAPADGYLSCYRIAPGLAMDIKGTTYTVPELLGEPDATTTSTSRRQVPASANARFLASCIPCVQWRQASDLSRATSAACPSWCWTALAPP